MDVQVVFCPHCRGTNVIPDINADGSFGGMWCAGCKTEFELRKKMSYNLKALAKRLLLMCIGYAIIFSVVPDVEKSLLVIVATTFGVVGGWFAAINAVNSGELR